MISDHLQALYGAAAAEPLAKRVAVLLEHWRPRLPAPGRGARSGLGLTQKDALLITYADQVRAGEPGESPLRTLAAFCTAHLKGALSGVHVLPFYPWSSDDGFSVKDFFAVEPAYGTWEDIGQLGAAGFDLMFDAVFNHVSAQSEWFRRFLAGDPEYADFFISVAGTPDLSQVVRPRALPLLTEFKTAAGPAKVWTTFSADQVDLNFKNPEVLLRVLEALLFYVSRGARFIRLDAIAFLWKEIGSPCLHLPQTHEVIRFLRTVLDEVAPRVLLITETNVPHADNLSYFGNGANEAQLVYNFALPPLVLHSFAAGNAGKLTAWARTLSLPSDRVTFLNFLASHDGVGLNPVRGILTDAELEALVKAAADHGGLVSYKNTPDGRQMPYELNINYVDALSSPAANEAPEVASRKLLTAHAILYSLRGVPAIYFHSLFGSRGDPQGAASSRIPRRINRQKLVRFDLEQQLRNTSPLRHQVFSGQRELLRIRAQHAAFSPDARQCILDIDPRVFAVLREPGYGTQSVLCLQNVSGHSVRMDLPPGPRGSEWTMLTGQVRKTTRGLELSPWATAWLAG